MNELYSSYISRTCKGCSQRLCRISDSLGILPEQQNNIVHKFGILHLLGPGSFSFPTTEPPPPRPTTHYLSVPSNYQNQFTTLLITYKALDVLSSKSHQPELKTHDDTTFSVAATLAQIFCLILYSIQGHYAPLGNI